jgi:cobalt-zinc-cadmium efflux system membrane fusion protein
MKTTSILIPFFLLASCKGTTDSRPEETAKEENTVSLSASQLSQGQIETALPERGTGTAILQLNGFIDVPPQNMISVSFPLGGYLKSTNLLPGMEVRKGEVIAQLEDLSFVQLQQDYLSARAREQMLLADYERQRLLNQDQASSDKVLQQSKSDLDENRIRLKALAEKLRLLGLNPEKLNESNLSGTIKITSPIHGYVASVKVNVGKYISPTDVLFELVNPEDIHLNLIAYEQDIPLLSIGQKVKAKTNGNSAETHDAEIILISRNLDQNRSAEVHCHFLRPEHKNLLPGMYMNAMVEVNQRESLLIPEEAVVQWQGEPHVLVQKDSAEFRLIKVVVSPAGNNQSAINNQDLAGKKIVVKNAYAVLMAMKNSGEE